MRNYDNFSRVLEIANQLLYLAPWMNGNAISSLYFLNVDNVCFLLLVRCSYNQQNDTWLLSRYGISHLLFNSTSHQFAGFTHEIPSWTHTRREIPHLRAPMYYSTFIGISSTCAQRRWKTLSKVVVLTGKEPLSIVNQIRERAWLILPAFFSAINTISHHNAP